MKLSRVMESSGLVVTHFGGKHTYDDALGALHEITELHKDKNDIYEIVFHADDMEIELSRDEINRLRGTVISTLSRFEKGALAFVSDRDFIFGMCRQLELMMDNENIVISVFRSEGLARQWIDEIKTMHDGVNR